MSGDASAAAAWAFAAALAWLLGSAEAPDAVWAYLLDAGDSVEISSESAGRAAPVDPVDVVVTLSQYRFSPGGPDGPPIELEAGITYRITFRASDVPHGVSAIPQLGIEGREVAPGNDYVVTVTPSVAGLYAFACTRVCGGGHGSMRGAIEVTAPTPERGTIARPRQTRLVPPRG